jgi:hypothetical protein
METTLRQSPFYGVGRSYAMNFTYYAVFSTNSKKLRINSTREWVPVSR